MDDHAARNWTLTYEGYDPAAQPLREALTTLGNGVFATRGSFAECTAGGPHYPGTYVAGVFNRLESEVAGRIVSNESLVNLPSWLPLAFRIDGGEFLRPDRVEILEACQRLDLRRGILAREMRFADGAGREFLLESERLVHMGRRDTAVLAWTITPRNWSGTLEIRSAIDGRVTNGGVARYRDLDGQHVDVVRTEAVGEESVLMLSRTNQSRVLVAQAVRTRAFAGKVRATAERRTELDPDQAAQILRVEVEAGKPLRVEKVLGLATSRTPATSEPAAAAAKVVRRLPDLDTLREGHTRAWRHLWDRADVVVENSTADAQLVLRLHIFHLLQTVSPQLIGADVGVPARGLHGEAYRGHIFWDELFTLPFLTYRMPELTRSLLMYRYRRLDEARHLAAQEGLAGAMFPWQSGSDGREESQQLHLNPESGEWVADNTHRQRHVAAAIAWNVWQYHEVTGDDEFLSFYGAEMLLEIARMWASLAEWDADRERYVIRGVVGPDEFHTQRLGSDTLGLDNNAYTNVMAVWCLRTALAALQRLPDDRGTELRETLGITQEDLVVWREITSLMFVPFHGEGIISQFEGWEDLEELDWEGLRQRHGDIQRLDRILGAEGDDPNRYQATKQADVLLLFYLLPAEELREILEHLGYGWDDELIPRNVRYYLARTSHGSTLSRVVHAWVLSRSDRKQSWHLFHDALMSDVEDIQGGTTSEGVHLGAMAGTVDLVQRCYTGMQSRDGVLWLNPLLPEALGRLHLRIRHRGRWLDLDLGPDTLTVAVETGTSTPARVGFAGEVHELPPGASRTFTLAQPDADPSAAEGDS
jgi:alpha,alpha-trehalase